MRQLLKYRSVRVLLILAALTGVYALGGFILAPKLLRNALLGQVDRNLGVRPTVGAIHFNPFLLQLEIRDFALPDPAGGSLFSVQRLFVDFELSSIWHRALVFKDIEINAPYVHPAISRSGALNLLALQPRVAAAPEPPKADAGKSTLPRIEIARFRVSDGNVTYEDQSRATPFAARIEPLNLDLYDFSTGVQGGRFDFAGATAAGERIAWQGHLALQPLVSDGEFHVTNLQVQTLWRYLKDQLAFAISSGTIELNGRYDFALRDRPELQVTLESLVVANLGIHPNAVADDWIVLPALHLKDARFDLQHRQIAVDAVDLNALKLKLWIEPGGALNLAQLALTPPGAAADKPALPVAPLAPRPPAQPAPPDWQLTLRDFRLTDATVSAEDRRQQPAIPITLGPLNLGISGASLDLARPLTVNFDTGINGQGRFAATGTVVPQPLTSDIAVTAAGLQLTSLQPYLAQMTSITLLGGTLGAGLHVSLRPDRRGSPTLAATGSVTVDRLHTIDNALREDLVRWERLNITGIALHHNPDRLTIDTISATRPYARVELAPDRSLNIARALRPPGASTGASTGASPGASTGDAPPPAATAASAVVPRAKVAKAKSGTAQRRQQGAAGDAAPAMPVSIRRILLQSGQAQFADQSVNPHFAAGIVALNGSVLGLSSAADSRAQIDLKGQVDQFSPVTIAGAANVLSTSRYVDLAMDFRNMELTTFNPYSDKFAGYNISKGKLTTELKYRIVGNQLDAGHHVIIDQLEFGDKTDSKDAVSLPVKLAVALLKDRHGVIDLDVPVTGTLDDPNFRLGPIIWKVVVNLLVKVVTSPFALLGKLFGGGPDLQFVDFTPGSATLDEATRQKMVAVGKALDERPQLKIELPIAVADSADRAALVEQRFEQELSAAGHEPAGSANVRAAGAGDTDRLKLLSSVYRQEFGVAPKFPEAPKSTGTDPSSGVTEAVAAKVAFLEKTLHEHITVTDADLKALAQARAQALQQALLAGTSIDPTRVFLVANNKVATLPDKVRLELSLQ